MTPARIAVPRKRTQPPSPQSSRTKLVRAIRAAARRKGMDDDDRRAAQASVIGKHSLSDMGVAELARFLDHLNKGWSGTPVKNERAHLGKMRALWWSLYWLGAIDRPDDEALTLFVKRQTGIEHLRFLDHLKAPSVIEALKSWLLREGVMWWAQSDIDSMPQPFTSAHADRYAVIICIAERLERHGVLSADRFWEQADRHIGRVGASRWSMTTVELDAVIREFGKRLRRNLDPQPLA